MWLTWHRPTPTTKNNTEDSSLRAIAISCIEPAEEVQNTIAKCGSTSIYGIAVRRMCVTTAEGASQTDLEGKQLNDSRVGA